MTIRFWGVRGTMSTPGPSTLRYGGHTSCVSVETDTLVLVIDAGSGIMALGDALSGTDKEVVLVFTHRHLDHVSAFPFFQLLYEPGRVVHLVDYQDEDTSWSPVQLFDGMLYPMDPDQLPADLRRVPSIPADFLAAHGLQLDRFRLNHPGGAYGYRVSCDGHTWVHVSDNELDSTHPGHRPFEAFVEACRGADVLSHDAQFLPDDLPHKRGWGHSLATRACDLAVAAQVRQLVLFHHDPSRDDDALDDLERDAQAYLAPHGIDCLAAYEGLTLTLC